MREADAFDQSQNLHWYFRSDHCLLRLDSSFGLNSLEIFDSRFVSNYFNY